MLKRHRATVDEERSTRQQPLSDSAADELLRQVERVRIARGRKILELPAREANLDNLKGPTGKYRAPMVISGSTLLVGFNLEALEGLL